ncbi:hypothetical protein AB434_0851 [Heyndrickxia coagulans]|uniref:Uncharacterized protein n=1 Tax=Heyndrickxia coagulans TaxID=1398 RepID=A0AAN0WAI4_HEYCO|nr:hypothetical protein SB48_HM08orf00478 [Heyndrickxia coagulans]AKN53256.1 hypothetical protein AB434_0851 [Heyndrickxia coagulans]KYC60892.1 hypothetical protein B4100_1691 [Heyndrickxia coagulans]KYC82778.1 hypothetical protein B4096_1625 [Heyndrickxia coagulans]
MARLKTECRRKWQWPDLAVACKGKRADSTPALKGERR